MPEAVRQVFEKLGVAAHASLPLLRPHDDVTIRVAHAQCAVLVAPALAEPRGVAGGEPAAVLLRARVRNERALRARAAPHDAIACAAQLPAALGGRALPDRRCALTGCAVNARALAVAR
eukprot:scaffold28338_cov63-Phaeocystis_antarctica.AAC.3